MAQTPTVIFWPTTWRRGRRMGVDSVAAVWPPPPPPPPPPLPSTLRPRPSSKFPLLPLLSSGLLLAVPPVLLGSGPTLLARTCAGDGGALPPAVMATAKGRRLAADWSGHLPSRAASASRRLVTDTRPACSDRPRSPTGFSTGMPYACSNASSSSSSFSSSSRSSNRRPRPPPSSLSSSSPSLVLLVLVLVVVVLLLRLCAASPRGQL